MSATAPFDNFINPDPATHTRGPWRLDDPIHADVLSEDYHCIDAGRGYCTEDDRNGFGISGFMSLADARVMAAAPTMLAALYEALDYFEAREDINYDGTGPNAAMSLANEIRAAIAKAEGRTHG